MEKAYLQAMEEHVWKDPLKKKAPLHRMSWCNKQRWEEKTVGVQQKFYIYFTLVSPRWLKIEFLRYL